MLIENAPVSHHNSDYEALVTEQQVAQAEKFQGRLLGEYSKYLFPGQDWAVPEGSATVDFVKPYCEGDRASLEGVFTGMKALHPDRLLHWADMGGGRGLAMRQLAHDPALMGNIRMTNVDLFDYDLDGLDISEVNHLEGLSRGITDKSAKPALIQANAESVELSEPADVITSIEAIQYLNNPLAAIANWYNQLSDNGLLMVAAPRHWTGWIHYAQNPSMTGKPEIPFQDLLEEIQRVGIEFAATDEVDLEGVRPTLYPEEIRSLIIRKKSGTFMQLNADVQQISVTPSYYKVVYYNRPARGEAPLVRIMTAK